MQAAQPHINPLGSYGVVTAAAMLGISRSTLRRYEQQGYIMCRVNKLGQRRYTGKALLKLWQMFY